MHKIKNTIATEAPTNLQNRRYIGNKYNLSDWIFSIIDSECEGNTFADLFAGTGAVSAKACIRYKKIILNDLLFSNFAIYHAFFKDAKWDKQKLTKHLRRYNLVDPKVTDHNYFSRNFGGNFFSIDSAKVIGFIREDIEKNKGKLTEKEYYILIASLLYSADKVANTVGHYDAYLKKSNHIKKPFFLKLINPLKANKVNIYREDANILVKRIKADIVYIDPPYNSRQYSRFYHILENLTKWDKPKLFGVALKPEPENMSDYSKNAAKDKLTKLIEDLDAKYLVVSYNNTYSPKSSSSKNKITHEQIINILEKKGKTKVFEKQYKHFNSGKSNFTDHKEYLFVTHVNHK